MNIWKAILDFLGLLIGIKRPNQLTEENMITISKIPSRGDQGQEIKTLQTLLKGKGCDPGGIDGVFGAQTQRAIAAFQRSFGSSGTGNIGPITLQKLGLQVVVPTVKGLITKDLQGKKDRHLHPKFRAALEAVLFANGIPQSFLRKDLIQMVIDIDLAMEKLDMREVGGNNRGEFVGYVQGVTGDYKPYGNGDAWCMDKNQCRIAFMEDYLCVESPVPASAHCMTVFRGAEKVPGLVTYLPELGSMYVGRHGTSDKGHTGDVIGLPGRGVPYKLSLEQMYAYEGNTADSNISDGDGDSFRVRHVSKNGDLVTQGFVRTYPNNEIPA
jgi:hypothetical protein